MGKEVYYSFHARSVRFKYGRYELHNVLYTIVFGRKFIQIYGASYNKLLLNAILKLYHSPYLLFESFLCTCEAEISSIVCDVFPANKTLMLQQQVAGL